MDLSRIVTEINSDFSGKSQIFPTPCILRPRWRGRKIQGVGNQIKTKIQYPLEFGIGAGGSKN